MEGEESEVKYHLNLECLNLECLNLECLNLDLRGLKDCADITPIP